MRSAYWVGDGFESRPSTATLLMSFHIRYPTKLDKVGEGGRGDAIAQKKAQLYTIAQLGLYDNGCAFKFMQMARNI